jgi:hypothetical protein
MGALLNNPVFIMSITTLLKSPVNSCKEKSSLFAFTVEPFCKVSAGIAGNGILFVLS